MKISTHARFFVLLTALFAAAIAARPLATTQENYTPTPENLKARAWFQDAKFGMFIHWGVYSVLGDGEWIRKTRQSTGRTTRRCRRFSIRSSLTRRRGYRWQKPQE